MYTHIPVGGVCVCVCVYMYIYIYSQPVRGFRLNTMIGQLMSKLLNIHFTKHYQAFISNNYKSMEQQKKNTEFKNINKIVQICKYNYENPSVKIRMEEKNDHCHFV